jgi:chorismate lyase/3-hydroxybenzoate synthase
MTSYTQPMQHGGPDTAAIRPMPGPTTEPIPEPASNPLAAHHPRTPCALPVPAWAILLARGTTRTIPVLHSTSTGHGTLPPNINFETTLSSSSLAALVSITADGVSDWSPLTLDATVDTMLLHALQTLKATPFPEPIRAWNFLPGICTPLEDGLDRYRVFNIARHRVFSQWFGQGEVASGLIPTATCVGHRSPTLSVHLLGAPTRGTTVENPRQISAYAYSTKFGPLPPCFCRAKLVEINGQTLLLVAGTASVRGEDSVHDNSLSAQIRETLENLCAISHEGRRAAGLTPGRTSIEGVIASRIYYKNAHDLPAIKKLLPPTILAAPDVEFLHADICREELLVEVELVLDLSNA